MTIKTVNGGVMQGTYKTAVGNANQYAFIGFYRELKDKTIGVGFYVMWTPIVQGKLGSTTSWSGIILADEGGKGLQMYTTWILTRSSRDSGSKNYPRNLNQRPNDL